MNTWCQDSWLPHSWSGSHSTLQCTAAHPRQEVQWGQSWIIAVLCRAAQCALHLAPPPLLCKLPTLYSALYCSVQYASEEESVQCCTLSTVVLIYSVYVVKCSVGCTSGTAVKCSALVAQLASIPVAAVPALHCSRPRGTSASRYYNISLLARTFPVYPAIAQKC